MEWQGGEGESPSVDSYHVLQNAWQTFSSELYRSGCLPPACNSLIIHRTKLSRRVETINCSQDSLRWHKHEREQWMKGSYFHGTWSMDKSPSRNFSLLVWGPNRQKLYPMKVTCPNTHCQFYLWSSSIQFPKPGENQSEFICPESILDSNSGEYFCILFCLCFYIKVDPQKPKYGLG